MLEILTVKAWALESRFFNRMVPHVMFRISHGADLSGLVHKSIQNRPEVAAGQVRQIDSSLYYSGDIGDVYLGEEENSFIARNVLSGVVSKNGGMCSDGTKALGEKMRMDDEKSTVIAHLLEIDSPGGAVDGTMEFASVVAGLTKPVVAFVDNMAASAAYWVASQASHIVTNSKNFTEIGSIGTLCILTNESEYLKKEGMKIEIMRASKSVDKARLNSIEEWPESSLEERQKYLNTINTQFIKGVNTGRNGKLQTMGEDIFTGRMYDQKRALALGMIDQIGTLEDAIQAALKLSKSHKTTNK